MNNLADTIRRSLEELRPVEAGAMREHPRWRAIHERSKVFLAGWGLLPCERTVRYVDRACVASGCALCFPSASEELLQLVVDWTIHNCLHDDFIEGVSDPYEIARFGQRYRAILGGAPAADDDHPLIRAMCEWTRRAARLTPRGWLSAFAARADRMCRSFILERLMHETAVRVPVKEYVAMRAAAGPFDTWFEFVALALPAIPAEPSGGAGRLRELAVLLAVLGNEIRTYGRERARRCQFGLGARTGVADDEALAEVAALHDGACREFARIRSSLHETWQRTFADALAVALLATDHYERESCRGLRWDAERGRSTFVHDPRSCAAD